MQNDQNSENIGNKSSTDRGVLQSAGEQVQFNNLFKQTGVRMIIWMCLE